MAKKKKMYKATEDGCVIETRHGTVVYEKIDGIPARAIAQVENYFHKQGIDPDWKMVEQRLVEKGVIAEARS
jgi:hypothetical protein